MPLSRLFLFIFAVVLTLSVTQARAAEFVWQDEATKLAFAFPDTWAVVNDQKPDDVITVVAPGAENVAVCRLRTRADRRSVIYPRYLAASVQHLNYSREFWENYAGEFGAAQINSVTDNAGLGLAFAGMADISFVTEGEPAMRKRGLMLAGVYNDTAYIFECSSDVSVYDQWYQPFLKVLSSVRMGKVRDEYRSGYYRPFETDLPLHIYNYDPRDPYIY